VFDTPIDDVKFEKIDIASNIVLAGECVLLLCEDIYEECDIKWWSASGVLMGTEIVKGEGMLCSTPKMQGVYLLEINAGDIVVVRKIIVK
jgi:hypothetical protein